MTGIFVIVAGITHVQVGARQRVDVVYHIIHSYLVYYRFVNFYIL